MNGLDHVAALITTVFVAILDRFRFPIRPVDAIFPHGDRENVVQVHARMHVPVDDHLSVAPFEITDGDEVFSGIAPEEFVGFETDRQGVRPSKMVLDQHGLIGSVHAGLTDVRLITPVGPVHVPTEGVQYDRSGFLEVLRDQDLPISSIEFGYFYRVQALVTPI